MNNRIREVRKQSGLSMQAFGDRIGVSSPSVSKIESGINNPSEQTIRAICSEFNVNRDWLVDGVGEMKATLPLLPDLIHNLRKYPNALQFLSTISPDEWTVLDGLLARAFESKQKKDG